MTQNPRGVSDHPAKSQMEEIWKSGGRAQEILSYLQDNNLPVIDQRTIARYGQRYWNEKVTIGLESNPEDIYQLIDEIESSGIGKVTKVGFSKKTYASGGEGSEQRIEVTPSAIPRLERAEIPKIKITGKGSRGTSSKPGDLKLAMVIPDPQMGGNLSGDGSLATTHDEAAIDVTRQLMVEAEATYGIDTVINLGDALDFPAFSSHRSAPGYTLTTQYAIDRWATELAVQRSIAKDADIIAISGNHENRLNNILVDKIPALHGITRANGSDPLLSVGYLCRYEENGIIGIEEYPDGAWWANNFLRFVHGDKVSSALGGTAGKYLNSSTVSTIYGHIHRQELLWSITETKEGSRDIFAGSPGCLCRLDGLVPSGQTGIRPSGGQAGIKRERWQHGVFFVWYETTGAEASWPEPVVIRNGMAVYNGKRFISTVTPNGEPLNG